MAKLKNVVSKQDATRRVRTISRYYLDAGDVSESKPFAEAQKGKDEREIKERL